MSKREEEYRRISEMAGYDVNGCILPPAKGAKIDRSASKWWRSADYSSAPEEPDERA